MFDLYSVLRATLIGIFSMMRLKHNSIIFLWKVQRYLVKNYHSNIYFQLVNMAEIGWIISLKLFNAFFFQKIATVKTFTL